VLRKGDRVDDDTRWLESKMAGVTIGAEVAQVAGMVAGEVRAIIAAIRFGTCG
jgi:hypothetical protein